MQSARQARVQDTCCRALKRQDHNLLRKLCAQIGVRAVTPAIRTHQSCSFTDCYLHKQTQPFQLSNRISALQPNISSTLVFR